MLIAVIRLMLLPNINLSQKVLYVIEPVLFIGSWCYGTICYRFWCYEPVLVVGLCLPPCLMLLAVTVVGGFMVTTICDVGGFRVTTMPDGMALFEMQLRWFCQHLIPDVW